jgi:hypothetical protein
VHPGGYDQANWRPPDGTLTGPLPPTAAPLEPHKAAVIFLPELANPDHRGTAEGAYGTAFYGLPARTGGAFPEPRGRTVDRVIWDSVSSRPSRTLALALGVQVDLPPVPAARGATRCFWTGENRPVYPEQNPALVYQRLFMGVTQPVVDPAVMRMIVERKSILDYVFFNLETLRRRLGSEDRLAIEAHMEAVRGVERHLAGIVGPMSCGGQPAGMTDIADRNAFPKILDAQLELAVAALRCGLTEVVTVQVSNAVGSNVDFSAFVPGIPVGAMMGQNHKRIVDRWLVDRFAGLLTKLKAAPDLAGGTLLDSCAVLWGSHMYDGGPTQPQKVSWMLAGSCGGYFKTGQCVAGGKPISSVLADICKAMGVPGTPFGPLHGSLAAV